MTVALRVMPCAGTGSRAIRAMRLTRPDWEDRGEDSSLDQPGIAVVLKEVRDDRLYLLWLTLAMTGLRGGEACLGFALG